MPDLKALHDRALARFRYIAEVESKQRISELEALKFQAGDQWPEEAKQSRGGVQAADGRPAVPARPMLTMRTLDQPLAQVINQERDADLGISIIPKDGDARKETAEVLQGLVRAIEVDSHADEVYSWGFQRMAACGRGYWRVDKTYARDETGTDQALRICPIENGASVYLDPMPSWQHGGGFWEPDYGFITEDIPEAEYKRRFGSSLLATAPESESLTGIGDNRQHWVIDGPDNQKSYRIAEYWCAEYSTTEGDEGREIVSRSVTWAKMNGVEWLDKPQEWDGRFIPIIPDTGNKYNVGGQVFYEGMVQPAISPCRMLNYMVSAAAEKIGLATLSPWLGSAGQFQGYEAWWNQANTRNFPTLEYNAITAATGAQILPPPTRNNDEPAIQAFGEMIGLFTNMIRSITGVPDAALGHVNPNDRSGKAIEELKRASEQGTSNYLSNHARAIRHTGVVLLDLIPHVYDRPGRVERILGKDNKPSSVLLNAPFTRDEQGQPQPAGQPGLMRRASNAMGFTEPEAVEEHQLEQGQYAVVVRVGKSQDTRRQEAVVAMGALAQAAPELVPKYADIWVRSMDIPFSDEIADRLKPPTPEGMENLPPEAKALIQQMQAQMQELQQAADDNLTKRAIATEGNQTKLQVVQTQSQTDLMIAEMRAQIDQMAKQVELLRVGAEMEQEERLKEADHRSAISQQLHGSAHELAMSKVSHEQQRELAAEGHLQGMEAGERGHEQALEQGAQPPPRDPNKPSKPSKS